MAWRRSRWCPWLLAALPFLAGCTLPPIGGNGNDGSHGGTGGDGALPTHTQAQIQQVWQTLKPVEGLARYDEEPRWTAPFATGRVNREFAEQGVRFANFARYLCGLPYDVELDDDLMDLAQHGAVLLAAVNQLTHTPSKPSDMGQSFYDKGYQSTSSSNLFYGVGADFSAADAVRAFLSDNDPGNILWLGHRRWVLNPPMRKTAFGVCNGYMAMQVFDTSRTPEVSWSRMLWPCEGNMPAEVFSQGDPWSVVVSTDRYDNTRTSDIAVTVERTSDSASWTLTPEDNDPAGTYMAVDTHGYATPFCIIFRPADLTWAPGDTFRVTVTGLVPKVADADDTLEYETTFFSLGDS